MGSGVHVPMPAHMELIMQLVYTEAALDMRKSVPDSLQDVRMDSRLLPVHKRSQPESALLRSTSFFHKLSLYVQDRCVIFQHP